MKTQLSLCALLVIICGCQKQSPQQQILERIKALDPVQTTMTKEMLLPGEEAAAKECEEVLQRLQTDGVSGAFEKIRQLSPLSSAEIDRLQKGTTEQLDAVKPRFGKIIGYERVRVLRKGESVLECVYISKCERHILRWRFYFYKPSEKWFLNAFFWDDRIDEL